MNDNQQNDPNKIPYFVTTTQENVTIYNGNMLDGDMMPISESFFTRPLTPECETVSSYTWLVHRLVDEHLPLQTSLYKIIYKGGKILFYQQNKRGDTESESFLISFKEERNRSWINTHVFDTGVTIFAIPGRFFERQSAVPLAVHQTEKRLHSEASRIKEEYRRGASATPPPAPKDAPLDVSPSPSEALCEMIMNQIMNEE